ncbi:hypothetical protein [Dictyobacter kobayashii]|uniref:Uncharacterized protein n=1 Tax=Dictyobacter kobayashii TaxID=2014872 RepID=A0A402AYQ8_9CHLR|nr:hypothetical protein [Dictyobacter kobayashii]GCE24207.1 hypothetical protein KDK_80070 [Dictyobacter kobayashii]
MVRTKQQRLEEKRRLANAKSRAKHKESLRRKDRETKQRWRRKGIIQPPLIFKPGVRRSDMGTAIPTRPTTMQKTIQYLAKVPTQFQEQIARRTRLTIFLLLVGIALIGGILLYMIFVTAY